jgi:hypothetical protein
MLTQPFESSQRAGRRRDWSLGAALGRNQRRTLSFALEDLLVQGQGCGRSWTIDSERRVSIAPGTGSLRLSSPGLPARRATAFSCSPPTPPVASTSRADHAQVLALGVPLPFALSRAVF